MITDLLLSSIFLAFFVLGLARPSIALAGVIWIDMLRPQTMFASFYIDKPVSAVAAAVLFISFLFSWERWSVPVKKANMILLPIFIGWITYTTINAFFPVQAWWKYDISVKTIFIAIFIPFVLNTRHRIETALWICVISVGFYCTQGGLKTLAGSSGYGIHLLNATDGGITESSTLSAAAIMALPIILYLLKHSLLVKALPPLKFVLYWFIAASLLTMVGTHARTGLVCLAAFIGLNAIASKEKWKYVVAGLVMTAALALFASDEWAERMGTMTNTKEEASALGRIVVWRWTLDFVKENPNGGGFQAYLANASVLASYAKEDEALNTFTYAKAFHNILFEVLGEHGYFGLFIFCTILLHGAWCNILSRRQGQANQEIWREDMAIALMRALIVICVGGMFVNIAFFPVIWFLIAFAVSLHNIPFTADVGETKPVAATPQTVTLKPVRQSIYWQYRQLPSVANSPRNS